MPCIYVRVEYVVERSAIQTKFRILYESIVFWGLQYDGYWLWRRKLKLAILRAIWSTS